MSRKIITNIAFGLFLGMQITCQAVELKNNKQLQSNHTEMASDFTIEIAAGRLSAKIDDVPLGHVLKELGRQARINIYISASIAAEKITATFDNKPLAQGIKQILASHSYALTYGNVDENETNSNIFINSNANNNQITELRLVSGAGPIIDLQIDDTNPLQIKHVAGRSEPGISEIKSAITEALAVSDTYALNDLMHEIENHPDQEAAIKAFRQANKEHEENSVITAESEEGGSTQNAGDDLQNLNADIEFNSSAPDIEQLAFNALQTKDTYALNEVMQMIADHPDQQVALEAFAAANRANSALQGRPKLR